MSAKILLVLCAVLGIVLIIQNKMAPKINPAPRTEAVSPVRERSVVLPGPAATPATAGAEQGGQGTSMEKTKESKEDRPVYDPPLPSEILDG